MTYLGSMAEDRWEREADREQSAGLGWVSCRHVPMG